MSTRQREKGKCFAIIGIALQVAPIFGLLGMVIGMIRAFTKISSFQGQINPEALASNINFALITTAIGFAIGIAGLIFVALALFSFKYKAKWFFWTLIAFSVLWILNFPIGTVIGIVVIIYLVLKKDDFLVCEKNTTEQGTGADA